MSYTPTTEPLSYTPQGTPPPPFPVTGSLGLAVSVIRLHSFPLQARNASSASPPLPSSPLRFPPLLLTPPPCPAFSPFPFLLPFLPPTPQFLSCFCSPHNLQARESYIKPNPLSTLEDAISKVLPAETKPQDGRSPEGQSHFQGGAD